MKEKEYMTPSMTIMDMECEASICADSKKEKVDIYDEEYNDAWD